MSNPADLEGQVVLTLEDWDVLLKKLPKCPQKEDVRAQAFEELRYWFPEVCKDR